MEPQTPSLTDQELTELGDKLNPVLSEFAEDLAVLQASGAELSIEDAMATLADLIRNPYQEFSHPDRRRLVRVGAALMGALMLDIIRDKSI
ncbi:hypothetical protein LJC19_04845 [Oxalobacter sp. OttesenSCG-928-P03]|nr:hypothetical protein [Oxalobacter sp. OttesenSCG-928-P03]